MHYKTSIQCLMAHVRDLQSQNQQLQRSPQELFQAGAVLYIVSVPLFSL